MVLTWTRTPSVGSFACAPLIVRACIYVCSRSVRCPLGRFAPRFDQLAAACILLAFHCTHAGFVTASSMFVPKATALAELSFLISTLAGLSYFTDHVKRSNTRCSIDWFTTKERCVHGSSDMGPVVGITARVRLLRDASFIHLVLSGRAAARREENILD